MKERWRSYLADDNAGAKEVIWGDSLVFAQMSREGGKEGWEGGKVSVFEGLYLRR
jgi:hypothetical protein